jgi:hypothetical protein
MFLDFFNKILRGPLENNDIISFEKNGRGRGVINLDDFQISPGFQF